MKEIEQIQVKTPSYDEMDDAVENVRYDVPSSSNKESANKNSSDSSYGIFSSKYLSN